MPTGRNCAFMEVRNADRMTILLQQQSHKELGGVPHEGTMLTHRSS